MRGDRATAWWIRLVSGLRAVAVGWDAVVDRGEVRLGIRTVAERRDDVVNGVSALGLADVANDAIPQRDGGSQVLPVRWQGYAPISAHALIVLFERTVR